MATCAECGRESPDEFGFCPGCGSPLTATASLREVRKVVTVVFCDLVGSTALGDRTDPEALRALMTRYYDEARAILERHGGTVEKFVGDAVMAVFGIPVASEDDALRAVRAAVELRDAVAALELTGRIGVNTGEVVAGEGGTLVTGDAVNVAARLEQGAGAGETVIGEATFQLVRDAVVTEPVELTVKGKARPLAAHRLVSLDAVAMGVARRLDRPMIGRERERERLRADFADVAATGACRLFTLIGPAGVGKSRLVADFLEHVGGTATVARGRALSYGEGITYWPLVEVLVQLGIDPDEALRSSAADTQLATRALLERHARLRPLVLVLDDLHWAEPPLLDLVDHIADWAREAPIFLLCIARPELLDLRPGWGGGKLNATSILLEPLSGDESALLLDSVLAHEPFGDELRARVLAVAEGNPLFIEELSALARETGGAVEVPPTIQAVLQARLDRLSEPERVVIERGAVEGKVFHRGAVTALSSEPHRGDVASHLLKLVRKELIRPDTTRIPGDDAFRFRHLLIRDTAYEALPKAMRAELHERFADWLAEHGGLLELDEMVGYHFEQAARCLRELDPGDAHAAELAGRAAERLGVAGRAAFEREDHHATRNLLGRAYALLPSGAARRSLIPDLFDARELGGDVAGLDELVGDLTTGDERDAAMATVLRAQTEFTTARGRSFRELETEVLAARDTLQAAGDEMGLVRADRVLAELAWAVCQVGKSFDLCLSVFERLRRLGSKAYQAEIVTAIQIGVVFARRPVDETRRVLDELYGDAHDAGPLLESSLQAARARMDYTAGSIDRDELLSVLDRHLELLRQTGSRREAMLTSNYVGVMHWLEDDDATAERFERARIAALEADGGHGYLAHALGSWAATLCRLGRPEEALQAVERGRALARADDIADQLKLDSTEAFARALAGAVERSAQLLERVEVALAEIDMPFLVEDAAYDEAGTLAALGDVQGARALLVRLRDEAGARGRHRWAARYQRDLDALG